MHECEKCWKQNVGVYLRKKKKRSQTLIKYHHVFNRNSVGSFYLVAHFYRSKYEIIQFQRNAKFVDFRYLSNTSFDFMVGINGFSFKKNNSKMQLNALVVPIKSEFFQLPYLEFLRFSMFFKLRSTHWTKLGGFFTTFYLPPLELFPTIFFYKFESAETIVCIYILCLLQHISTDHSSNWCTQHKCSIIILF